MRFEQRCNLGIAVGPVCLDGNNTEIVSTDEALRALLTVQYTGTGVLHGRWQIAEPESSEGVPFYRTLALVNTNLQTSQRSTLRSPALPSTRPGKYLLRVLVRNASTGSAAQTRKNGGCSGSIR